MAGRRRATHPEDDALPPMFDVSIELGVAGSGHEALYESAPEPGPFCLFGPCVPPPPRTPPSSRSGAAGWGSVDTAVRAGVMPGTRAVEFTFGAATGILFGGIHGDVLMLASLDWAVLVHATPRLALFAYGTYGGAGGGLIHVFNSEVWQGGFGLMGSVGTPRAPPPPPRSDDPDEWLRTHPMPRASMPDDADDDEPRARAPWTPAR